MYMLLFLFVSIPQRGISIHLLVHTSIYLRLGVNVASPGIKQLLAALAGKPLGTPVFGIGKNPIPTFKEGFSPPGERPNTLYSPGGAANPAMLEQLTPWQGPSFNENIVPTGPRTPTQMGVSPFEKWYDLPEGFKLERDVPSGRLGDRNPYVTRSMTPEQVQEWDKTGQRPKGLGYRIDADYSLKAPTGENSGVVWGNAYPNKINLDVFTGAGHERPGETPISPAVNQALMRIIMRMAESSGTPLDSIIENPKLAKLALKASEKGRIKLTNRAKNEAGSTIREESTGPIPYWRH